MIQTNSYLKKLEKIVNKNRQLSNSDICNILKVIQDIAIDKDSINTLLYFLNTMIPNIDSRYLQLTKREQQVLNLIGIGKQNNDIAKDLNLKTSTIETHRKNIRKKLQITGRSRLLEYAILNNLNEKFNSTNTRKPTPLKSN